MTGKVRILTDTTCIEVSGRGRLAIPLGPSREII